MIPPLTSRGEMIETLYQDLRTILTNIPVTDKILLLGDFIARVGQDYNTCDSLSKYGLGKMNGFLLAELCTQFNFVICNCFFIIKEIHKVTWIYSRSKNGHTVDYVITDKHDNQDVCSVKAWGLLTEIQTTLA